MAGQGGAGRGKARQGKARTLCQEHKTNEEVKMKKPNRHFECYYEGNKLRRSITSPGLVISFFFFWILPLIVVMDLIMSFFRDEFWITEQDYYKTKLEELKNDGTKNIKD